jgi:muramoyltetrapeptide carboxypeptidase
LEKGKLILEQIGIKFIYSGLKLKERGSLAGTDEERFEDLVSAFKSKDTSAVMAARGGYGCLRLLSKIDWSDLPAKKPLIGFSDITALHLSRLAQTGHGGWHASGLSSFNIYKQKTLTEMLDALTGLKRKNWSFPGRDVLRTGLAKGPLIGGNLTIINSLLATKYLPDLKGAILMLEDINEQGYKLDRQLVTLWLSGKIKNIAGLVFGDFVNCGVPITIKNTLANFTRDFIPDIPVVKGAPFGHGKQNTPWWYGETAELAVDSTKGELIFQND